MKYNIELIDINKIKPIEGYYEDRVKKLLREFKKSNIWTTPIIVEKHVFTIMDGHHRFEVARRLKLKRVPCWLVCYYEDVLAAYSLREKYKDEGPDDFLRRGLSGNIYPPSTAKHIFKVSKPNNKYQISFYYLKHA